MNVTAVIASLLLTQSWSTYTSKTDGFTALFPGKVTTSTDTSNQGDLVIKTNIYVASGASAACVFSSTAIPPKMSKNEHDKLNDGIKSGFLKSSGFSEVSESTAKFNGFSGRLVKVKRDAMQGAIWIIDRGNIVYTMTALNRTGDSTEIEKKFFGSVKLSK